MEKVEISNVSLEELEMNVKKWVREVLNETGMNQSVCSKSINAMEAAEYLNMAVGTLYKKTAACDIPHIKRGKALLFYKSDLDKWLESKRKQMVKGEEVVSLQRSLIRQIRARG